MTRSTHNPWLHRFAALTALAVWGLIGIGGLVTSHGAGMSVPDWPTTYGYNMFLFPPSQWIGGIFYEHTHRLFASFVGLLTTILMVWLWLKESRPSLRWLGVIAFFTVVLQGVLGGLRVTLFKDQIGIFHAMLAQSFFALVTIIAVLTSARWQKWATSKAMTVISRPLRFGFALATVLVFIQLVLGATMRHQHAGLAVPDFPLAYGKIWPPTDAAFLDNVNRSRVDYRDQNPITSFQIELHMMHRIGALLTLAAVAWVAWRARREMASGASLRKWSLGWLALILAQASLGAATVLSNKAADVATAHVVFGAASLVLGAVQCLVVFRFSSKTALSATAGAGEWERSSGPFKTSASAA